jgi:hypothetical protein
MFRQKKNSFDNSAKTLYSSFKIRLVIIEVG